MRNLSELLETRPDYETLHRIAKKHGLIRRNNSSYFAGGPTPTKRTRLVSLLRAKDSLIVWPDGEGGETVQRIEVGGGKTAELHSISPKPGSTAPGLPFSQYLDSRTEKAEYPPELFPYIEARAKAQNARDQAGRRLIEEVDRLGEAERAELIATQRDQHKIVAQANNIIREWKQDGTLPEPRPTVEQLAAAEGEWKEQQRVRSRARAKLKKWREEGNEERITYFETLERKADTRLRELAPVLGKTMRT